MQSPILDTLSSLPPPAGHSVVEDAMHPGHKRYAEQDLDALAELAEPLPASPFPSHTEAEDQSDNEGEGGVQGYQGPQTAVSRDADSDSIVLRLERSLPKWPGYGEQGWYEEQNMASACPHPAPTHSHLMDLV